jgi:hypothetical protein
MNDEGERGVLGEQRVSIDLGNIVLAIKERLKCNDFQLDGRDWARLEFAFQLTTGASVLDVGTGHGALLHMLADSGLYKTIRGFDIKTHSKAVLREDVEYLNGSIAAPLLVMPRSDTVVCMEVLEHLEERYNSIALKNLRSHAVERLVVTLPFEEPEPVWWHDKPGGHRQSFSVEKLSKLFPTAFATRFPRYGVDWVFLIEDRKRPADSLNFVSRGEMLGLFGI